jgi:hypothetical protein
MDADAGVFFALWLQNPLRIAAAKPSGARLANAVARYIELTRPGPPGGAFRWAARAHRLGRPLGVRSFDRPIDAPADEDVESRPS